jgi:hypothetical protein
LRWKRRSSGQARRSPTPPSTPNGWKPKIGFTQAQASTPPPPPPKPKPPFQFFGFAQSAASGGQRVFLTDGENIFVARRGDLVMERYRVTQISEESIQIEDTGGELQWVLPLQQP